MSSTSSSSTCTNAISINSSTQDSTSSSVSDIDDAPVGLSTLLGGRWGPVRLYREAHLDDAEKSARWCMSVGLIRSGVKCRVHRRDRTLQVRADRQSLLGGVQVAGIV